ncbi:MAG: DUF2207 domain-containing protein [Hyphomonadaceae bacterium]|nr:DUF2207 domain-containing protein [Hyphomonadaceae bacterium]
MMLRALLVTLLTCLLSVSAFAAEKITSFDVSIDVQKNGDFIVTETIAVTAEGQKIRRGIFRDIPRYLQDGVYKIPQKFDVQSVTRNGNKEKYETSKENNALRIRIGNADRFIPHGPHVYEIKYKAKNQIRREETTDEVYWNATGTYWDFPIEKAKVEVRFPEPISGADINAYTGHRGANGSDYIHRRIGDSHVFTTTRPLARREGITVSLKFDKGVINPPSASQNRFIWWVKNGVMMVLSLTLFGILGYYYRAWNKVGRDPGKLPVFPRYQAPEGYSPAAVSHIHYKGFSKNRALVASLVDLGIKNMIEIDSAKKKTKFSMIDDGPAPKLPQEQSLLLHRMFPGQNRTLTLAGKTHTRFNGAREKFVKDVGKRYSKDYQRWNVGYMVVGAIISIAALIAAAISTFGPWKPIYFYILGALIITNILFFFLLPAPTKKGQAVSAEIEGFKLYLEKAEKLQMNAVKVGSEAPPPMTVERYERFLPYAIALGVEKPWSKYFQSVLPTEAETYAPHWSTGHFNSGNISRGLGSVVNNISSGVTSAAPQSSGSSGGGGGGFSGGGGGGGGGGGW